MNLEIRVLDLGDVVLESSFLVLARDCGKTAQVPTFGYLIIGGDAPVLVDTGYRSPEVMERLGMRGEQSREQTLHHQLAKHGVSFGDVRYVLHTHLHIDHAGQDDRFPMTTTIGINRRELEYAVSRLMGEQYPADDIKHLIDRLHTRDALRLFDLELSGLEEVVPGISVVAAGAHTEGSMNVLVETAAGTACISGDVIYDLHDQVIRPFHSEIGYDVLEREPTPTGNHGCSKRQEKSAIKRVLNAGRFVLPSHDRPGVIENGTIVGSLFESVPGQMHEAHGKRQWIAV